MRSLLQDIGWAAYASLAACMAVALVLLLALGGPVRPQFFVNPTTGNRVAIPYSHDVGNFVPTVRLDPSQIEDRR
jgi:hypothetical protein